MTNETPKTDGDTKMMILCRQLKSFQQQRDQAHEAQLGARINEEVLETGISKLSSKISELMKSGIKRFVVPDEVIETPVQQQIKPKVI